MLLYLYVGIRQDYIIKLKGKYKTHQIYVNDSLKN